MNIELSHPEGFKPFQYQREDIEKGSAMRRFINSNDMGCGKSLESIATALYLNQFPCLVICPSTLKINWQEEIETWTDKKALILNNKHIHTWQAYIDPGHYGGMFAGQFDFFIVNYESLKKFFVYEYKKKKPKLKDILFNPFIRLFRTVIVDECHLINNPDSQRAKLVKGITSGKKNIMMLTGTPIVNDIKNLVPLISILGRLDKFGGRNGFMNRYGNGENLQDLKTKLDSFYFRREKKDVLKDLPDKFRSVIKLEITTKNEYNKAIEDLEGYFKKFTNKTDLDIERSMRGRAMVLMTTLRRIAANGKIKAIKEVVDNIISGGQKIILFMELRELVDEFKRIYPKAVIVQGGVSAHAKDRSVKAFQGDPDRQVILCNFKSGGVGLNLTAADNVGFVEYWWTWTTMSQSEDRAYRNGRKDNVNCLWFEGQGTIDYYIRKVIESRKELSEKATGARDSSLEKSQDEVFLELMRNLDRLKI